jgi:hypothetical protein
MAGRGKPAKHTQQSFSDQEAVSSLCAWIARSRRAMPDIRANDKWPNIDGYIVLTDIGGFPQGTLKTQVKKLSKSDAKAKRFKFSKKESREKFLAYCEESRELPIILVGVDTERQCAYWKHIDKLYLNSLKDGEDILFPSENIITLEVSDYVDDWLKIVKASDQKARIAEAFSAEELERITHSATRILGKENDNFRSIHLFLDKLNGQLDKDFRIIKEVFYLNAWKVGFAYYHYDANSVGYMLYPVPLASNDVLIKEVDQTLFDEFRQKGLGFSEHSSNPIESNPDEEVERVIKQRLDTLIKHRLCKHIGSDALAREYIIAFIERYPEQLNLSPDKESYAISEIDEALNQFLPFWLDEAFKFLHSTNGNGFKERLRTGRVPYYDLGWWNEIRRADLDNIKIRALERIKNKEQIPVLPIGASELSPRIFAELFNSLKVKTDLVKVTRLYTPRNTNVSTIFQFYTPREVKDNLTVFFNNFPYAYSAFLDNNFPDLKERLPFMGAANKLIFVYDLKSMPMHPIYTLYLLKDEGGDPDTQTEVLTREEFGQDDPWGAQNLSHKGRTYKIINYPRGSLNFIYSFTPMMDFIYGHLKSALGSYL